MNYDIMTLNWYPLDFHGQFSIKNKVSAAFDLTCPFKATLCVLPTTDDDGPLLLPTLLCDLLGSGPLHHLHHSRDQEQNLYGDQPDVRLQEQHRQGRADSQRSSQNGCDERLRDPRPVWRKIRRSEEVDLHVNQGFFSLSKFESTGATVAGIKCGPSVMTRRSAASCERYKDAIIHTKGKI